MKILYTKSRWEADGIPFEAYLDRVAADGFDGAEVFLFPEKEESARVRQLLDDRGLILVAQVIMLGDCAADQQASLEDQMSRAAACGAAFANCHSGSDFFGFEDNLRLLARTSELSEVHGLPVYHETHRGRAFYSLPETLRYLDVMPGLEFTSDFSHFMCVHESDLRGREALLDRVIQRTRHIHARVGFAQGPQVAHPLSPEWEPLAERYLGFWKGMLGAIERGGAPWASITPEAGPPPYMPVLPFTGQPLADAWTVNVQMKNWLKSRL